MERYHIRGGVLDATYLDTGRMASLLVAQIEDQVLAYLDELQTWFSTNRLAKKTNVRKRLPWLFSVTDTLADVRDRPLISLPYHRDFLV